MRNHEHPDEQLKISYSGVRGVYGRSLTLDVAARFAHAFVELVSAGQEEPPTLQQSGDIIGKRRKDRTSPGKDVEGEVPHKGRSVREEDGEGTGRMARRRQDRPCDPEGCQGGLFRNDDVRLDGCVPGLSGKEARESASHPDEPAPQ